MAAPVSDHFYLAVAVALPAMAIRGVWGQFGSYKEVERKLDLPWDQALNRFVDSRFKVHILSSSKL